MAATLKTATYVRRLPDLGISEQRLYKLSTPVEYRSSDLDEEEVQYTSHLIVSRTTWLNETMAFPARANGTLINLMELNFDSYNQTHTECLERMGYQVIDNWHSNG